MIGPLKRGPRFGNLDGLQIPPEKWIRRVLRWRLNRRSEPIFPDATDAPAAPWPKATEHIVPRADGTRVTWLGHATTYVEHRGHALITDPIFGPVAFGKPRLAPAPVALAHIPRLDGVLISHNHLDHCDLPSIRGLRTRFPAVPIVVPQGLAGWMEKKVGPPVVELAWWESTTLGPFEVVFTPAQHWSTRVGLDVCQSHWGGYLMKTPTHGVFFAGDTGLGPHFEAISARFDVDIALLPIGAYAPRWFMREQHMNPEDAIAAAETLDAHLIPIHWGTYRLTDEPLDEPPRWAQRAAAEREVETTILRPGGSWTPAAVCGKWTCADIA